MTGANGFVGAPLSALLEQRGYEVRRIVREIGPGAHSGSIPVGDIVTFTDWPRVVKHVDAIVHLAARAHVLRERAPDFAARYRAVNVESTVRLADAAARGGVRRFVFVSSVGVNGSETCGRPFTEKDPPAPGEPYAASKWEAEQALLQVQAKCGLELVIVRPPLIYGPGAKGNLLRMLELLALGIPLPLGGLSSPRSFIGLDNLCTLLVACLDTPRAAGELLLAAEPERRSTAELLETIAAAMGHRHQLWRCPMPLLMVAAAAVGKVVELKKLSAALEVDPSKAMQVLGWRPHVAFADGVRATVDAFLSSRG